MEDHSEPGRVPALKPHLRSPHQYSTRAAVAASLAAIFFLVSCTATRPPDRVVLDTLQSLRATVVTGMKSFNVAYQAGQATEAQRTQVLAAYDKYLAADKVAALSLGATVDPNAVLPNVQAAVAELMKLIQSFVPKGP